MDGARNGEGMTQREAVRMSAERVSNASALKELAAQLGANLLKKSGSDRDEWLLGLQTQLDDKELLAFEVKENGQTVGFVLADKEGSITQLRVAEGKTAAVVSEALRALKEKGIQHPSIRIKETDEDLRHTLHHIGFAHGEHGEDGKIEMRKE